MAQARKVAPVKRRNVYWNVYFVELGPTHGSEIKKSRPAVIIQNDIDNHYSPITIIAPITSTMALVNDAFADRPCLGRHLTPRTRAASSG